MPEPFDLEALVRAARPEPAPAWVGKLDRRGGGGVSGPARRGAWEVGRRDRRVAERFPAPPRWWQWQTVRPNLQAISAVGAVVVVFVAIIGLAGSSNHGGSDDSGSSAGSSGSAKSPNQVASGGESTGAAGSRVTPFAQVP